jgi:hypothetical protein
LGLGAALGDDLFGTLMFPPVGGNGNQGIINNRSGNGGSTAIIN